MQKVVSQEKQKMFETIYSSPTNYNSLRRLPSVKEQVELCRNIASQLVANDNINSKGANMFFKRVKKAHTWEVPPLDSKEQEMMENIDEDKMRQKLAQTLLHSNNKQNRLSLVMDPRGKIHSLSSLKAEGYNINEHNVVPQDVVSRLIKDLESPEANPKAAELFAKRKAMAQEWELEESRQQQQKQEQRSASTTTMTNTTTTSSAQSSTPVPMTHSNNNNTSTKPMPTINGWNISSMSGKENAPLVVQRRPNPSFMMDSSLMRDDGCKKRFSLLDPDVFVPTAGSGLSTSSSSSSCRMMSTKSPSPWRRNAGSSSLTTVQDEDETKNCNRSTAAATVAGVSSQKALTPSSSSASASLLPTTTAAALTTRTRTSPFSSTTHPHPTQTPTQNPISFSSPLPLPLPLTLTSPDTYPQNPHPHPHLLPPSRTSCTSPTSSSASYLHKSDDFYNFYNNNIMMNNNKNSCSTKTAFAAASPLPATATTSITTSQLPSSLSNLSLCNINNRTPAATRILSPNFATNNMQHHRHSYQPPLVGEYHNINNNSYMRDNLTAESDRHSNAGSVSDCSSGNNFSNYTNYFYQTLKHSNPYQNLPESILL